MIKLEADGLVEKIRSQKDGRQWAACLTEKGQNEAQRLKLEYDSQVAGMMECFSREQLEALHGLLDTLTDHWNTMDLCFGQKNTKKPR